MKVTLTLEDGSTYPLAGKLQFTDVTVDQSTGAVMLRAIFPNPRHLLLPGMYVRAEIEEGVDRDGILVPQQAVSRNTKGDATALVVGAGQCRELRASRPAARRRQVGGDRRPEAGRPGDRRGPAERPARRRRDAGPDDGPMLASSAAP